MLRSFISNIKKFVSRYVNIRIPDGHGITTDNSIKIDKLPESVDIIKPRNKYSPVYIVNPKFNEFELYGQIRNTNGGSGYRLRNIETGIDIYVPENIFKALFIKNS